MPVTVTWELDAASDRLFIEDVIVWVFLGAHRNNNSAVSYSREIYWELCTLKIAPPNTSLSLETSWWQAHSNEFVSQSARRSYQIFSLAAIKKKECVLPQFWYQNIMTEQTWMDTALAALLLLRTTDETHSYHVNILTCRIKAMCELVTKHVTNGAITQRPEMKEHLIHKNSRNAACVRDRSLDPVKSRNGWLNNHHYYSFKIFSRFWLV